MNDTHDPKLTSWVVSANHPSTDFPIQNLPLGVFSRGSEGPRIGVAIGDHILDLRACARSDLLIGIDEAVRDAAAGDRLNGLMALGNAASAGLRRRCAEILSEGAPERVDLLVRMNEARMMLPADIGDYTDFYASIHHATNVGRMFRPDHPLLPNYRYVPIGYHGRASSVVVSGKPVDRPMGQIKPDPNSAPEFAPSRSLDFELEVGFFVGSSNRLGRPVPIAEARERLFGVCLLNDWSARDVQSWEYQPLGPFLSKSFATTISPWVVTLDALEPFRVAPPARPAGDPAPLDYLSEAGDQQSGAFDIVLEVWLHPAGTDQPVRLARVRFAPSMYWTPAQLLTHHASNGCNLRPGDLFASGTVSGPDDGERGCLLEITQRGSTPLKLADGSQRTFLEDGDEVIFRAYCEREGFRRIGFGECRGRVMPALVEPAPADDYVQRPTA